MLGAHPRIHAFDRPRTFRMEASGLRLALAGFPFAKDIGTRFGGLLAQTGWDTEAADVRLLCLHQTVEGARVGPVGFTFRSGADVIPGASIPQGLDAVLSGHIHRAQVLTRDLGGRPMSAPVFYPGSIERTSRAERNERKGYLKLEIAPGTRARCRFAELPARPMIDLRVDARAHGAPILERIASLLSQVALDAVVRLEIEGAAVTEEQLRSIAPATMNVELAKRAAGVRHAAPGRI
jgi:DNA repair exonuclease SbcCD nuclease subunit